MGRWIAAALALIATTAFARPSEEDIARLGGPELTPVGAERAGNAETAEVYAARMQKMRQLLL